MRTCILIIVLLMGTAAMSEPSHDYPLKPLSFEKVTLQDSFWLPRLHTPDAIRICMLPQDGHCMGIHQIQLGF